MPVFTDLLIATRKFKITWAEVKGVNMVTSINIGVFVVTHRVLPNPNPTH